MINYIYFAAFWACQIIASILFKWGGINPKYHGHALIIGNAILLSASWFLIQLFKNVSQPIVITLCSGGHLLPYSWLWHYTSKRLFPGYRYLVSLLL